MVPPTAWLRLRRPAVSKNTPAGSIPASNGGQPQRSLLLGVLLARPMLSLVTPSILSKLGSKQATRRPVGCGIASGAFGEQKGYVRKFYGSCPAERVGTCTRQTHEVSSLLTANVSTGVRFFSWADISLGWRCCRNGHQLHGKGQEGSSSSSIQWIAAAAPSGNT